MIEAIIAGTVVVITVCSIVVGQEEVQKMFLELKVNSLEKRIYLNMKVRGKLKERHRRVVAKWERLKKELENL